MRNSPVMRDYVINRTECRDSAIKLHATPQSVKDDRKKFYRA